VSAELSEAEMRALQQLLHSTATQLSRGALSQRLDVRSSLPADFRY
jgi:hypothetical protein